MEKIYIDISKILKALSDPKRLQIIDMLSCGELCACTILEAFQITQPTLSHDMKILVNAGLVTLRKEGRNIFYSLDRKTLQNFTFLLEQITSPKENCICARNR